MRKIRPLTDLQMSRLIYLTLYPGERAKDGARREGITESSYKITKVFLAKKLGKDRYEYRTVDMVVAFLEGRYGHLADLSLMGDNYFRAIGNLCAAIRAIEE